jgi:hypothetical protein
VETERTVLGRELLLEAAELVSRGWVQGVDAIDANGGAVEPWDESAAAWSLLGALVASLERRPAPGGLPAVGELAGACTALVPYVDHDVLSTWNDAPERTQGEVLAALRAAAADAADRAGSWN